jgi:hypothetical protein
MICEDETSTLSVTPSGYMAPGSKDRARQKRLHSRVFKSHLKTGDYQRNERDKLSEVANKKLTPYLPPKSVFVVDNAPYRNVQFNTVPADQTTKAKIMEWLTVNNVPFRHRMLKTDKGTNSATKLSNIHYNGCTWTRGVTAPTLSSRLESDWTRLG